MKKYQAILMILAAGCGTAAAANALKLDLSARAGSGRASRLVLLEPAKLRPVGRYDFKADAPRQKEQKALLSQTIKSINAALGTGNAVLENYKKAQQETPAVETPAQKTPEQNAREAEDLLSKADRIIEEAKAEAKEPEEAPRPAPVEVEPAKPAEPESVAASARAVEADIILKFKPNAENLTKSDAKKVAELYERLGANADTTLKIMSYYSTPEGRNRAFARLLNTRKALLDKGMSSSQAIIMVLEDDTPDKARANSVEIVAIGNK